MKTLAQIANENTFRMRSVFKYLVFAILFIYIISSIFIVEQEKQRANDYLQNILANNIKSVVEEDRLLFMVKSFSDNFELKVKSSGDLCGVNNCYSISFEKTYRKLIYRSVIFGLLIVLMLYLISQMAMKQSSALKKELLDLEKILLSEEFNQSALMSYEANKILEIINEREENLKYIFNSKSVAHDIRSPLSVLEMISQELGELPEDVRELIQMSIERINSIANKLSGIKIKETTVCFSRLIPKIINEKSMELKNTAIIDFKDETQKNELVKFEGTDLARIISNLINNCAQSSKEKVQIKLSLKVVKNEIKLIFRDDGPGFPKEILENPIVEGKTIGKDNGQGLGLFSAFKIVTDNKGSFHLRNDGGAVVEIILPITP